MRVVLTKRLFGLLITGLAITAPLHRAQAADADVVREYRDRQAIEALMWHYVRALDSLDADAYAANFTPDGQFGTGAKAEKGRDALRDMILNLRKTRAEREAKGEPPSAPMYHVITNSHVEFIDKDHARFYSYWMTVFAAGAKEAPPRVAAAGRGIDQLVRRNGTWLIQARDVAPTD
jgi:uncharacterized protein (TIGR02246 family)